MRRKIAFKSIRLTPALLITLWFLPGLWLAAADQPVPQPSGPVILEITGNVAVKNFEHGVQLDYDMLTALEQVELEIDTPWTKPGTRFGGILTRELMEFVGASGEEIHAVAMDGYSITIPFDDLVNFDTVLALSMNGERMRLRTKGPSWVIYHPDDKPEAPDTVLNSRMIWQLKTLEVR